MNALSLGRLRADGQAFTEEISRESYFAHSGLKPVAEYAPIYDKYAHVLGSEALDLTINLYHDSEKGTEQHRSARYLLEWQLESQASRSLASLDEAETALESSAYVETDDGRRVQYEATSIEIANEADRGQRLALDQARTTFVEREHAPLRLERLQREKDFIESLGIGASYNAAFEEITGISLPQLAAECRAFLVDTQSMWDDTLPRFLRASLGIKPGEATRADALALLRAAEFDRAFPGKALQDSVRRQLTEMQLDPDAVRKMRKENAQKHNAEPARELATRVGADEGDPPAAGRRQAPAGRAARRARRIRRKAACLLCGATSRCSRPD